MQKKLSKRLLREFLFEDPLKPIPNGFVPDT